MRGLSRPWFVAGALFTLVLLLLPGSVAAATEQVAQETPGTTVRTIWDTTEVHVLRLPHGVNHEGPIHVELTFQPTWADLDLYLLDADGAVLEQEMGLMAVAPGREVIDHAVDEVRDTTVVVDDEGRRTMTGDTYYVVIVAFNEAADYQVWGYYPQIDLDVGSSPSYDWNYGLSEFRSPTEADDWAGIKGPAYGYPYDFRPTSLGDGGCRLEWPAEVLDGAWQVTYDPTTAPMPANLEQYLYASWRWFELTRNYGGVDNHLPPPWPEGGYGLIDSFTVSAVGVARPMRLLHYVPSLFLAYADPRRGPEGGPKVGETTLGFKATLTYPENLRLAGVKRLPDAYRLTGTFALNGRWVPGAEVIVERKILGSDWLTVETVVTDENGRWSVRLHPRLSWKVRARAVGDATTGLPEECSVAVFLKHLSE